ncbi:ORF007 [Spodoptera frugiperda granulovirus]|uniref:ORF007 n=1 Tax=Spodoptera frugiperda granulovirus TaxID=307454 RepID=A0A068FPF2_9BBAC|nr:ORF007 [Spodoptera frugiperda granulovirus]AID68444.1 hypothetical protein [Spodoptera frugiperda granulovirus]AJK91668.1 ORF007 [Spodoptera frugiperda granulovirus]AXS01026.1 ORF007 [Spodoptera frugiperda granulovirus]
MVDIISVTYDDECVWYNFDELMQLMVQFDFECVDKKSVDSARVCVKSRNEQVFVTDGAQMAVRVLEHDECYIDIDGILHIVAHSVFGDKTAMEKLLARCTTCVLKCEHPWQKKFTCYLQQRARDSFDVYMKVCRQYFMSGRPRSEEIGPTVDRLVKEASRLLHQSTNYDDIITSYVLYDKAVRLILGTF